MAAEVAAFLLKQKLQNDLANEIIVYPRLKRRIHGSIFALQKLLNFLNDTDLHQEVDGISFQALPIIYNAEDVVDTYLLRRAQQRRKDYIGTYSPFRYLSPLLIQKDLNKGLKKLLNDLKHLPSHSIEHNNRPSRGEVLDGIHGSGQNYVHEGHFHRWGSISHLLDKESDIIGQESDIDKMVAKLTMLGDPIEGQRLGVISVVGTGGSGKTTMVKRVYNRVDVKNHFERLAWVCVPRDSVKRDVVLSILEQVRIDKLSDIDHMDISVLDEMLTKELMDKKYLIVLDDVWNIEAWHELTIAFPDSGNGSKVILTTCNNEVAKSADLWGCPLQLHRLTNDERWELLLKQMKKSESGSNDQKDKIMAKVHHGSALEIVLLGGILSTTKPSDWSTTIDKFPTSLEGKSTLPKILALSYQALAPQLKACFLYLGIFPKALEIPVRRLMWLWLSEGFIDVFTREERLKMDPEAMAEIYFATLVSRNLVEVTKWKLDGSPKMCRMSGVIHDFFFPKALDSGLFYVHQNSDQHPRTLNIRRLVEYPDIENNLDSCVDQNLRSYISFNAKVRGTANKEVGMFLKTVIQKRGFALLKVLNLEGIYKPMLPKAIRTLLLLRFLGLRSTVLDSIPSIVGDLPCLETLDLKHTNVTTLPISIWKAKNLQHLYLNEVHIDVYKLPKGSLTNLHALRGLHIGSKKAVTNGLDRLVNLRKLGLTCYENSLGAVARWIRQLQHLHSLKLRSIDEFGNPSNLEVITLKGHHNLCNLYLLGSLPVPVEQLLPIHLRKLTLSMINLKEDPMPVLGQLHDLSILRLFANSYMGTRMACASGGFPKLRVLKLWMLNELEVWTVEEKAMPIIREIEIRRCGGLEDLHGLEHLASLNEVILTNMPDHFIEKVRRSIKNDVYVKVNDWKLSQYQE